MTRKAIAGVVIGALGVGGVVLGSLIAALLASGPADAGGWGHRGHGGPGYYGHGGHGYYGSGYGRHGYYRHGGGFRLRLVFPLYYGGDAYYGRRGYDPYPRYAAPLPAYAPPPAAAPAPAPQAAPAARAYCREYSGPVVINGQQVSSYGTACLQEDGSWRIVD